MAGQLGEDRPPVGFVDPLQGEGQRMMDPSSGEGGERFADRVADESMGELIRGDRTGGLVHQSGLEHFGQRRA